MTEENEASENDYPGGEAPDDQDAPSPHHVNQELLSAESVREFVQEMANEEGRKADFNDCLKAQRLLKKAQQTQHVRRSLSKTASRSSLMGQVRRSSLPVNNGLRASTTNVRGSIGGLNAYADNGRRVSTMDVRRSAMAGLNAYASMKGLDMGASMREVDEESQNDDEETGGEKIHDKNEEGDSHHGHGHNLRIPFYSRPAQRQMWDDDQVLPHVNWGDLFFDLFYVAAAYNLGVMLIDAGGKDEWGRGIVYFIAMFGPIYNIWRNDVVHSSRYTLLDYVHRFVDVVRFLCVALAVGAIKPLTHISDQKSGETLTYTAAIFLESLIQVLIHLEVYYYGEGDRAAIKNHTKLRIFGQVIPATVCYMAAFIVALVSFISAGSSDHHRLLGEEAPSKGCDHRMLGGDGGGYEVEKCPDNWPFVNIPLCICLVYYVLNIIHDIFRKYLSSGYTGDLREKFVPNNVDYMIHRFGEWIMLMIGESVLSLLVVETVETPEYYMIEIFGIFTVILIQMLKFESEPSHADGHALWRSIFKASMFDLMIQILSMALIAFGVSYKIMLSSLKPNDYNEKDSKHRYLAAMPTIETSDVATLFCISLTIVLLSMEVMMATHKGVKKFYQVFFHELETMNFSELNWPLLIIVLWKVILIVFIATLHTYVTESVHIALIGLIVILLMCFTRFAGWGLVQYEEDIMEAIVTFKSTTRERLGFFSDALMNGDEIFDTSLWDASFDAVVVTDRIGLIKYVNETVLAEFGYDAKDELVGQNVTVLVGGGDAEHHHKYMDRFNKNERKSTTIGKQRKLNARKKDGNEFPCMIGIKEISNSGLLVGFIRPITESDDDKNNEVHDTSFDSIIVIDPKGIIVEVNRTALGEFGYSSKEDLVGNNISILVGGGEAMNHDSYLETFHKEKKDDSAIGNSRVLKAKRKNGEEFSCVIGIKRASDGVNLVGYLRNMDGITAEDMDLKEKTKYLVDDTSFDSIIVADGEGTIVQVNATAVEEFGYNAKAELVGKNLSRLVGGGYARHHGRYMRNFKKKGKEETTIGQQRKLKARRKDGEEFTCVIGIRKIPDTEYLIGYIRSTAGLTKEEAKAEFNSVSRKSSVIASPLILQRKNLRGGTASKQSDGSTIASNSTPTPYSLSGNSEKVDGGDILDESFDAVIVADFDGTIRKVNQTVLDIFRFDSKDELVGNNISMLVGGGDAAMHDSYLKRFKEQGRTASQIGKQRVLYSKRKDGTEFPCIIGIKQAPKNAGLVGWIRDMTDLQQNQPGHDSLVEISNINFLDPVERVIDDSSFDAIIVTDFKGVIRRVNETTVRELRYDSKEELEGRNVSDLVGGKVSAKTHDRFLQNFQKAGKSSSTIGKQRVLWSKRKDGSEFRCIIGVNKVADAKQDLLVGYIRNLELAQEDSESKSGKSNDTETSAAQSSE